MKLSENMDSVSLMTHELWQILWVSLKVASITAVLVMLVSLWLGRVFAQSNTWLIRFCESLVYLPMAMPPVALGFGLLVLLGPKSAIGKALATADLEIAFTFFGALVAAFMASLGIGVRTMRTAYLALKPQYGEIARLYGASRAQTFCSITLPLVRPSLVSGLILVFIRALGEIGATLVLAGNTLGETRTLALAIWTTMQMPGQESEAWLVVIIAGAISLFALIISELILKAGRGRSLV